MKGKIRSFGVSDDYFLYDHSPDARVGIYYYENGAYPRKPKVIYDRSHSSFFSLNIDEIPKQVYTASRCFHTTGITLALSQQVRETAIEMLKRFKEAGTSGQGIRPERALRKSSLTWIFSFALRIRPDLPF